MLPGPLPLVKGGEGPGYEASCTGAYAFTLAFNFTGIMLVLDTTTAHAFRSSFFLSSSVSLVL